MRVSLPPAAILASLALLLAGCAAPPPPPPAIHPVGGAADLPAEDPRDEYAPSTGERWHVHDYWGGALEKTLMDSDVPSSDVAMQTLWGLMSQTPQGGAPGADELGATPVDLPEGSIVPPETHRVEVTVTWAESPLITGLKVSYRTAASENLTPLDPLPEGGGTYQIPTAVEHNDMAHTTVSKWRFFLVPVSEAGPAVFNGSAHVVVKAFRENFLSVAPPHPDHWGQATLRELFEIGGSLKCTCAVAPLLPTEWGQNYAFVGPPAGHIVPPHTGLLTLTLAWTNRALLGDATGVHAGLLFSSADTRTFREAPIASREAGTITYAIPLTNRMVDSPYANLSGWSFYVYLANDAVDDTGISGGSVGLFDGDFVLRGVGERELAMPQM